MGGQFSIEWTSVHHWRTQLLHILHSPAKLNGRKQPCSVRRTGDFCASSYSKCTQTYSLPIRVNRPATRHLCRFNLANHTLLAPFLRPLFCIAFLL